MISIILTCYKGEAYIKRALNAIYSQTFKDYEVIVVDEYGKDRVKDILEKYSQGNVKYFLKSDEGPGAAVHYGLSKCSFELVAILEQDDFWFEHKLENQVRAFDKNPELGLVSTDWCVGEIIPEKKCSVLQTYKHTDIGDSFKNLLIANYIVTSSVMLKRSIVEKVGFPDVEEIAKGPWDRQLWLRIVHKHPIAVVRDILTWKYVSPQTLFGANKNYSYLQYLGWLQALTYFRGIDEEYVHLIKNNIAKSCLGTAYHHLSNDSFYLFKKFVRESLRFDRKYVLKYSPSYALFHVLPAPVIRAARNIKHKFFPSEES